MNENLMIYTEDDFKNKIYTMRGVQVMLDSDLADFYGVKVKRLNEQVKRNISRYQDTLMNSCSS